MLDTFTSDWSNPGVIAAIIGLRILCNVVILVDIARVIGARSAHTAVVGGFVAVSTAGIVLLLGTGWGTVSAAYVEELSQLLIVLVSAHGVVQSDSGTASGAFVLAWCGAILLLAPTFLIYAEAFVAP